MRLALLLISCAVLTACKDSALSVPISTDDSDLQSVTATSRYDMADFSKRLARPLKLSEGMDRDTVEAQMRSYFGTAASSGSIPVFNSKVLADGEFEILATRDGLAGDRVKSEQAIVQFSDDVLIEYGMRVKCYRAPNPDEWMAKRCPKKIINEDLNNE